MVLKINVQIASDTIALILFLTLKVGVLKLLDFTIYLVLETLIPAP